MIDSSEKRNRQLALELQNSHVCEKRSKRPCEKPNNGSRLRDFNRKLWTCCYQLPMVFLK